MLLNTAGKVMVGDKPASAVYLGAMRVWGAKPAGAVSLLCPPAPGIVLLDGITFERDGHSCSTIDSSVSRLAMIYGWPGDGKPRTFRLSLTLSQAPTTPLTGKPWFVDINGQNVGTSVPIAAPAIPTSRAPVPSTTTRWFLLTDPGHAAAADAPVQIKFVVNSGRGTGKAMTLELLP
jgi:hypothetical protein